MIIKNFFQLDFESLNTQQLIKRISYTLDNPDEYTSPLIVGCLNLHALALINKDINYERIYRKLDFAYIDGMIVVWLLKLLGYSVPRSQRATVLDWHNNFFEMANERSLKVYCLGSTETSIKYAAELLKTKYPEIDLEYHHGYIAKNEISVGLKDKSIDVLLVGMGMPKQEIWIDSNMKKIDTKVIIPVGGYFDYLSGESYEPPRWAGQYGLEWFFRFCADPKRLFHRYFIEPWSLGKALTKEFIAHKRFKG